MGQTTESPFIFGVKVDGDAFTDRVEETRRLKANFSYGINTILISPRRMGKTSLVDKVCSITESDEIKIARFDAFACRCENDFINEYATAIIRSTSGRIDEWIENTKQFLSHFVPKISFGPDPLNDFSLSVEYTDARKNVDEILQLPEKIAKAKNIRIIVCIDEFQQIGDFPDSLTFQKKLRSTWQLQKNVSYCLFGSKKHMMEKMFMKQSYPFYRFGDTFYLQKISKEDWVEYICRKFRNSGKEISEELAGEICDVTERYSSYVQQLSWFVWYNTAETAGKEDLKFAVDRLLDASEPVFIQQTETLSAYQMNFLHAVANGISNGFTRSAVLKEYNIGTAANVARLKQSLTEKDLVCTTAPRNLEISDPILKLWLKKRIWRD